MIKKFPFLKFTYKYHSRQYTATISFCPILQHYIFLRAPFSVIEKRNSHSSSTYLFQSTFVISCYFLKTKSVPTIPADLFLLSFFIIKLEIRPREKRGIKDYLEKYEVVKNSWNFRVSNKQNVICFCRKWIRKEKLEMHFKSICHQEVMVCIFYISNPEFDSLYYLNCTYSC